MAEGLRSDSRPSSRTNPTILAQSESRSEGEKKHTRNKEGAGGKVGGFGKEKKKKSERTRRQFQIKCQNQGAN